MICCLLLLFLIRETVYCQNSPYSPHSLPEDGPYFEAWYTRLMIHEAPQKSIGIVFGTYISNTSKESGFIEVLYTLGDEKTHHIEVFPSETTQFVKNNTNAPQFTWEASGSGIRAILAADGTGTTSLYLQIQQQDSVHLELKLNSPLFWNPDNPDEGPEGPVQHLPIGSHWFIYSLASKTEWSSKNSNIFPKEEKNRTFSSRKQLGS